MSNLNNIRSTYDCALPTEQEMADFINNQDITLKIDKHNGRYNLVCYFTPFKGKFLNYIRCFNGKKQDMEIFRGGIYSDGQPTDDPNDWNRKTQRRSAGNQFAVKLVFKYWYNPCVIGKWGGVQIYQSQYKIAQPGGVVKTYGDWINNSTRYAPSANSIINQVRPFKTGFGNTVNKIIIRGSSAKAYQRKYPLIDTVNASWRRFTRLHPAGGYYDSDNKIFRQKLNKRTEFVIDETSARRGFMILMYDISPHIPKSFVEDIHDYQLSPLMDNKINHHIWSRKFWNSEDYIYNEEVSRRPAMNRNIYNSPVTICMSIKNLNGTSLLEKYSKTWMRHINSNLSYSWGHLSNTDFQGKELLIINNNIKSYPDGQSWPLETYQILGCDSNNPSNMIFEDNT